MSQERMFYNQPVRSLQWMLRHIAQHTGEIDLIIPSGVFDPPTQAAVSQFQREHGIPVTGVADRKTWNAIVHAYDDALHFTTPAQSVHLDLQANFPPAEGKYSPLLHLAQMMMFFLAKEYQSVFQPEQTGYMDEITGQSLSDFQNLTGLPMTGKLDQQTWNHLALHYSTAIAKDSLHTKREWAKNATGRT